MNYSVVIYILGWIMEIEAAFLALPGIVSAIYGEKGGFAFCGWHLAVRLQVQQLFCGNRRTCGFICGKVS